MDCYLVVRERTDAQSAKPDKKKKLAVALTSACGQLTFFHRWRLAKCSYMKNHPHHYVSSWFVIVELSQALETGHLLLSGWYFNMATEKRKTIKSGNKGTKRAEEYELALRTGGASASEYFRDSSI
ncbi:hypothetical protein CASFOL_018483 [Castilleja foliolosa]|uniref:Uncharacterized protein n=1 Tax=Castilleja foliolosa TaxID=1961234 RepID=A0ABD3DAW3_9LAMI